MCIIVLFLFVVFFGLVVCLFVVVGLFSDYDGLDWVQLFDDLQILVFDMMQGCEVGILGNVLVCGYIIECLEGIGVDLVGESFEYLFEYFFCCGLGECLLGVNILVEIEGISDSDYVMVLMVYFDYEGMCDGQIWNGVDDNVFGVVVFLVLVEDFVENLLEYDLIFVFVDVEEWGL